MSEGYLIGKKIVAVDLATNDQAIRFYVEGRDDPIVATAHAPCCSYTWIESLDAPELLLGVVLSVEDLTFGAEYDDCYDWLQKYGVKITTTSGVCVIDYRNSSNGYYGGDLKWPGEHSDYSIRRTMSYAWARIAGDNNND